MLLNLLVLDSVSNFNVRNLLSSNTHLHCMGFLFLKNSANASAGGKVTHQMKEKLLVKSEYVMILWQENVRGSKYRALGSMLDGTRVF